jgi:type II secretory pathway pseudopilin PulG
MTCQIPRRAIRPSSATPSVNRGGRVTAVRRSVLRMPRDGVARAGFTLVEILIAGVVLLVGLLALTTAGGAVVKLEYRGRRLARAAAAAESRLEMLRSLGCAATSGVGDDNNGLREQWGVQPLMPRTVELVDSVTHDVEYGATRERSHLFRSATLC